MHFQAVIFDLDGTLLDTLEDISDSVNSALLMYGFPTHVADVYRYFIGDGVAMLVTRALPAEKRDEATITNCIKAFQENYTNNWNVNTRPYDGVPELLKELAARHVKMAILSNKPDDFTKRCVRDLLPNNNFEIVFGQNERIPKKPDPAGAREIAEKLKIEPSQFLYLGDSGVDMMTAVRAGMFPVGALWGFRHKDELLQNGAQVVIEKPIELLGID